MDVQGFLGEKERLLKKFLSWAGAAKPTSAEFAARVTLGPTAASASASVGAIEAVLYIILDILHCI